MKGKKFDDIISQKLADLNPKLDPQSWDLFEEKMDAALTAGEGPSLPDRSFDEMIFGKLNSLQSEKDPKAWALFQEKLDKVSPDKPLPIMSFDQMIATQLRRQQPAYNHSHWLLLQKRLDWISYVTNRLALYKLSELALLLIFLFYLGQTSIAPDKQGLPDGYPIADQTENNQNTLDDFTDVQAKLKVENAQESDFSIADADQPIAKITRPAPEQSVAWLERTVNDQAEKPLLIAEADRNAINASLERSPNILSSRRLLSEMLPLDGMGLKVLPQSEKSIVERFKLSLAENGIPKTDEDLRLEEIADISTQPLVPERFISLASLIEPVNRKSIISFSMMGAFDYNRIITPENKEFRLTAFDRYEIGYGGGFLMGIEKGRLGIQTGGVYSFKKVRPIRVAYLEGNFDTGYLGEVLKEYDYSTISIPINITYDVFKNSGWRIYALAGASLNVVYESNYYVVLNRGKNSGGYGLSGSGFGSASTATTRTQLDEVKFPNGWFQGGSFGENSFLTTNIGIGVEKFLEDRWSIFAQPTYQHGLIFMNEGLGPFKDQLSIMSFFTGIRVRLIR
jgi:hypothetical protein